MLGLKQKDVSLFAEVVKQYGLTSLIGSLTYNRAYAQRFEHEDQYVEENNNKRINRSVVVEKYILHEDLLKP